MLSFKYEDQAVSEAVCKSWLRVVYAQIDCLFLLSGATFFSTLKHFFSTLTFFFNPATFLFHPRTLFFDPVTFFFNPCTCFFDPGPFFFNPVHLGPPDFPAARSASFTLDGSSSSRLPAYKLWAVGGPIWGLQWSGWVLEAT